MVARSKGPPWEIMTGWKNVRDERGGGGDLKRWLWCRTYQ